jgi:hypothetical protein
VELLAAIGGLSFVLASLIVGLRLLLLASRTRAFPELAMGLALFLMGGIGYPLTALARLATPLPDAIRTGFFALALLCALVGTLSAAIFNQRVFRPGRRAAVCAVVALGAAEGAFFLLQIISPGLQAGAFFNEGLGLRLFTSLHGVPLAWAACESFAYAAKLGRRVKLGLADPVVADRMRLWGISMLSALAINLASTITGFFGIDLAATAGGALLIAPLGLVAAGCTWLAFVPPAAYLRRVAARFAASGRASA